MNIVVIGATGRVGAATCARAQAMGWAVTGISSSTDWEIVEPSVDAVVNAAGVGLDGDARPDDDVLWFVNVGVAARAARLAGSRGAALVHVGTPQGRVVDAYTATKAEGAEVARDAAAAGGVPFVELRPHIVCGGVARTPNVVERIAATLARGETFPLRSPTTRRDLIHVDDVADVILAAALSTESPSEPIEFGTGEGWTLAHIAEEVARALAVTQTPWIATGAASAEPDRIADAQAAERLLGRPIAKSARACIEDSFILPSRRVAP